MKKLIKSTLACSLLSAGMLQAESAFDSLNKLKIGTFSGKAQLLAIHNDFSDSGNFWPRGNENATTASFTVNFLSEEFAGLRLGVEYINGGVLASGGGELENRFMEDAHGANWTGNGQLNVLNQLFVNYNLAALGLKKTDIKVGRQVLESTDGHWNGLSFLPKKNIRHKDQAVEAIVLTSEDIENIKFSLGHVEKFSNWGWTDKDGDMFDDVEDSFLRSLGQGINGASLEGAVNGQGMQFIEASYTGIENTTITLFDYYTDEVMNTVGAKLNYKLAEDLKFFTQYIHQDVIGDTKNYMKDNAPEGYTDAESDLFEVSLTKTVNGIDLRAGYLTILGNNEGDTYESMVLPFDNDFGIGGQLLVNTNSFAAGADNYYINATGVINKTFVLLQYTYSDHDNSTINYDAQEVDMIISHPLTENLSMQILGSYAIRNGKSGGKNGYASDARFGLTYKF